MAKYAIELSDELSYEIDASVGAPALMALDLEFEATTEDEVERLVTVLGLNPLDMKVTDTLQTRWSVPITQDGERVARCTVHLFLRGEIGRPAGKPPIPVLERLKAQAQAQHDRVVAAGLEHAGLTHKHA